YMEQRGVPFICAVNAFDGICHHTIDEIRNALQTDPSTPYIITDARNRQAVKQVLITLVEHTMSTITQG
ncbi:MAG: ATP-binding protein, partial [Actinomycetota bacterium]